MRRLLAGCCGLALLSLSAALNLKITQTPRFYGVKKGSNLGIMCVLNPRLQATVRWYRAESYDRDKLELNGERITLRESSLTRNAFLHIRNVQGNDSGVYFCNVDGTWGPGTQLVAMSTMDRSEAQYRSRMKEGLIIFQALLLAASIAAMLLRKRMRSEKDDSIYEEPEVDHIYEGLAIETCGGDLYEELSPYTQADGGDVAEAPWE